MTCTCIIDYSIAVEKFFPHLLNKLRLREIFVDNEWSMAGWTK